MKRVAGLIILLMIAASGINSFSILPVRASDLTISTARTFSSLDGSLDDDDGLVNGVLTVLGDLTLTSGGSITCNDPASPPNDPACPINISVSGDMVMQSGSAIYAENRLSGGNGGNITITVGGDLTLQSNANISSSKTSSGGGGIAGDITIKVPTGKIDLKQGSIVAANNANGRAGDITITADCIINVDGLVASGPSRTINSAPTRLTGFVLAGGGTVQQGATITINSGCTVNVSTTGIIVSQGEDPGADRVLLEACRIQIYGMVASVGKKQKAEVVLRAGINGVLINGTNLGGSGPNQGRVRADNTVDGADKSKVNIYSLGNITINGNCTGSIFTVTSNPGTANSRPAGGFITLISLKGRVNATCLAFEAGKNTAGNKGGKIVILANQTITLDTATLKAVGDFTPSGGLGTGGNITIRSYSGSISWKNGVGDAQPTGTANSGTITLTACSGIDTTGTTFPVTSGTFTPTTNNGVCSPGAPSLPSGEPALISPCKRADVDLEKRLDQPADGTADIGETVVFTIEIENDGVTTHTVVTLTDTYDNTKLDYISANPTPNGVNEGSGTLTWNDLTGPAPNGFNMDLGPNESFNVTVTFQALASTDPDTHNCATVTVDDDAPDLPDPADDQDCASVIIAFIPETPPPGVQVLKTRLSGSPVLVGETVVFRITVTNTGQTTLNFIRLEDFYDPGQLFFLSATTIPDHIHIHSATEGHLRWDDLTGPLPNGFNTELAPGASFIIDVTFKAIDVAGETCDSATVEDAEDENSLHTRTDPSIACVSIIRPPIEQELPRPVGGYLVPVNKLAILMPYLALVGLAVGIATVYYTRKKKI